MKHGDISDDGRILRETIMEVIENQIRGCDPPETAQTLDRLMADGISEEDARTYIAQAVCVELWHMGAKRTPFNLDRFVQNLRNLPNPPKE